jgi:hypothetical protein
MSGSLTWRNYKADAGTDHAVFRDESNAEATSSTTTGTTLLAPLVVGTNSIPGNIKPRYVNTQLSTNPVIKKRFIVGTLAIFSAIAAGASITENTTPVQVWNVTSKVGEKIRIPTSVDSGQTDGDPT